MNRLVLGIIVGVALCSGATWLLLHRGTDGAVTKAEAPAAKPEEKPNPLRLLAAKREQAGITLVKPERRALAPEVQAFGRVLDPTALATVVAEVETARTALVASGKELERAEKLFAAGGNASAQTVETAQAAAGRDRAALNSAEARLNAAWGRPVAQAAAEILAALAKGGSLVRLDVLLGEAPDVNAKEAHLSVPGRTGVVTAKIIGPAPTADPQIQGGGFIALAYDSGLAAGTALRATLLGIGESSNVLVLPRSAVVYHQGSAWIFVLGEEDTFERKLVTLGRGVGGADVVIQAGAEPDEQVAATGAQQLLAAELQAGGAGGEP